MMHEGVLLASRADSGCVDERHDGLTVAIHQSKEEASILIVDAQQVVVLVQSALQTLETRHTHTHLKVVARVLHARQQSLESTFTALHVREIQPLLNARTHKDHLTGNMAAGIRLLIHNVDEKMTDHYYSRLEKLQLRS